MKTDIKEKLKDYTSELKLPERHFQRFESLLEANFDKNTSSGKIRFMRIAASLVFILGMSYFAFFHPDSMPQTENDAVENLRLTEISPELKKIETYYVAALNYEFAKIDLVQIDKKTLRKYFERLEELTREYKKLDKQEIDLSDEELVNRLIDNLQLRLQLLMELRYEIQLKKQQNHEKKNS